MIRYPCGCKADVNHWVQMCEAHQKEERELRERWAREHKAFIERGVCEERFEDLDDVGDIA